MSRPNSAQQNTLTSEDINKLLYANAELLCAIQQESNQRKNKNFINSNMASLICELERNLMLICNSV
jgi:hypothetical protein